jgi:hypothetical protein
MSLISLSDLEPGELLQNDASGQVYVVIEVVHLLDGRVIPILTRTLTLTNPKEWSRVHAKKD